MLSDYFDILSYVPLRGVTLKTYILTILSMGIILRPLAGCDIRRFVQQHCASVVSYVPLRGVIALAVGWKLQVGVVSYVPLRGVRRYVGDCDCYPTSPCGV